MGLANAPTGGKRGAALRGAEVSFDDLEFIFAIAASGWEMPRPEGVERRHAPRVPYRVSACLECLDAAGRAERATVYTREASAAGMGFITQQPVPVGREAVLHVPSPGGQMQHLACRVLRCWEIVPGWFEAGVGFLGDNEAFRAAARTAA